MEVDSTYDELCHCLVKHQSQLKQKWKFAHGKKSDCVLCTVTEGPLLKCRQDRCENYLHIDCAASTTALYFDEENAMLTCWCESHFEPILFCSCKTPYDECKPMVYCDECCEWYHHSCEKLTDDVNDQEHYMCTSCTKLSLRASRVSDEIREKNRTKDVLYAQCNAGLSIANIWQSIDTEFCSKIDIVSKILHDEQAISKAEFDSVLHILEAMATANKDDSAMDTEESTPSGSEEMTGWKDLARALGEQSLVATWRQQLVDFNTELVIFNQDVQNLTHKLTQYFSTQFHNPSHDMIIEMSNLIRNMKEMCHNKLRIIVEVELGCTAFEENFEWMKEFMKLLHGLTTSDRWLATLKTHCRKVNTILRGLEEIKVEAMWFEYANWFAEYVQTAVSNTEKIVYWCNQWSAISKGGSTTYENLLALHEAASAFPIRIVFVEMLESWINKCKTFDEKILHLAKNHTELDQSMFEALKEERSNLSIVLTTDWLYSSLNQYFIFHAAYHLAMADARVEKDSLDVLIAAANDVLGMWQEVGSDMILIPSLKSKVEASAQVINKLLEESDAVVANIPRDDFDQMEKIGSLLPQLSVLRVITAEEKFILMVQDFQECVNKAQAILSRSSSIPITEVQANLDEFLKLYNMQITGEFMTLSSKRSVMRKNIASLNEIISQANQQWKSIEMAVDELTNGKSITLEYLQELMLQVQGLQISHPEIEAKVQQAIEKGQEVEAACDKLLTQSSHDVEAQHMEEVLAMLKTIQHHVISSKVSKLVRSRYDAFHLYQTCQDLLKQHSLTTDGAILPPKELIPLFQSVAKDLLKVEAFVEDKDCIEHQILAKIAAPILTTHWYIEVEAIMQSKEKIPFSHSQDLLNLAKERLSNTGIAQSAAYSSLSKDVLNFEQLKQEMHTVLVAFDTWNESTLLANIPEGLKQIAIQEPTQLFATVDQLQAFLSTQKDSIMEHHNQTKTIMDKVISESKFTDDKVEEIGALMNYCHFLYLSFVTVSKLHENYHREADPTGKEQSNVDMKHIVELLNCQKAFTSMKTPSMRYDLSKLLTEVYTHLQHATTIWIASKQEWMMLKQARNKQKIPEGGSAPVRVSINQMDIVAALNEGIAKMIRTPQHDRMVAVLLEIECIHQRLLHLLAPGLEGPKINDTESKVAIDDDLDEVSMFEEQVGDLLENLKSIREELSLIPVDTCDTHVIQYITQVLTWMASVPHPDDHESSQIIRMIEAKKKIAEASPIISEIEVSTINRLIEFGLMNEEGFIAQAHPFLKKAVDFLTHLEQSVERCQAYQEKLSLLLKSNEKIEVLEALLSEKLQLVVIPETDLVRNLEKEIALKKPKQVVPSKEVSHSTAVGHSASATAITKSKSRHLCLANCGNGIRPQLSIAYCSDRCMKNHAEKMMLSLLEYRYILHDFYHQQKDFSVTTMPTTNLSKRGREDMNAFDLADIAEVPSTRKEDQQMKNFLDLIYLDDRWSIGDISLKATVSQDHQKKGAFLDRMAIRLPKAASFISPLGKDPQAKIDMRLKTRLLLEDLFVSILHKTETPSSAFLGVLVAMEVEEGLFDKYSSNGKNLEKAGLQQYQKHIQMLMTNLRQPHNEHYTLSLSKAELTMDQFLGLTASDLANKDLQLKRQQGVDSLKQASHRVSTEEELENMVRLAMSGQETWRDGVRSTTKDAADNANATAKQISVDTNVATGDSEEMDLDSPKFHAASESMDEEEEPANTRFLEIESKVLNQKNQNNMNRNPKRPLEADASTRITRDDPKLKFAKLDPVRIAETKPSSAEKAPKGETTKVSTPTEAKAKAPNLLEMLKSKQIGTPVVEVSVSAPSPSKASAASPSSSSAASTPVTKTKPLGSPFTPCMRMINKDGKEDFTITRPGGILLHAAGLISEKRLQGAVKNSFNIDGRTKIADLDKYIKESIAANRKILSTFTFVINKSCTESYRKLCDEFVKDQRAGISNVSDTVQVYLIPPPLKSAIQLLQHLSLANIGQANILYGVIVGKAPGPSQYTDRDHVILPYDLNAFPPLQDSPQSLTSSSSSSMPSQIRPAAVPTPSMPTPSMPMPPKMPSALPNAFSAAPNAFNAAPVSRAPVINLDQIREVAKVCAQKGVAYIKAMKEKPDSKLVVPFIFEGNPGYDSFIQILSEYTMGASSSSNNAFSNMNTPSAPRQSRFN